MNTKDQCYRCGGRHNTAQCPHPQVHQIVPVTKAGILRSIVHRLAKLIGG